MDLKKTAKKAYKTGLSLTPVGIAASVIAPGGDSKRADRKAKRQDARQARKTATSQARIERKAAKQESRAQNIQARQERKALRVQSMADKRAAKANNRLAEVNEAAENLPADFGPENLPLTAKVKAVNYLKSRGRVVEDDNDPEILAAQFMEERARQIAQRHDAIENEIDDNPGLTDEEKEAMIPEYDEIENQILDEEANNFAFTGDPDNFVDPETIAMLGRVAKTGVEKYKEKRFAQGKKAFGRTAAQDKAIKAKKEKELATGEIDNPLKAAAQAVKDQIVTEKTKETVSEYTPYIIGGSILLVAVGVALYYSGRN